MFPFRDMDSIIIVARSEKPKTKSHIQPMLRSIT